MTNLYASPATHAQASTRRPSRRRLPRTSNTRRKLPELQKEAADLIDRRTPQHGTIRTEDKLTEWASTIATTTAKDAAVFG